ncbi:MAG TPA: hypothetical protein PLF13_02665 [candidate division Zixibacteria bacterium]|nr:hypothetical protein [candidate division Zixibacteria bacterium]
MKTLYYIPLFCLLMAGTITAQESANLSPERFGLENLSEYLSLKPDDIGYRSDYTEPDSFRLKIVADLMARPLDMVPYLEGLKSSAVKNQPEILASVLFGDLQGEHQIDRNPPYQAGVDELKRTYNLFYTEFELNQLLTRMATYIDVILPKSTEVSLARLSAEERRFLYKEFKELLVTRVEEEFYSPQQSDSAEKAEEAYTEQFVEFGGKIDMDPLLRAGIDCLRDAAMSSGMLLKRVGYDRIFMEEILRGTGYLPDDADRESYLGMQKGWKIGGPGNDYYSGDYTFILDFGGNDIYDLTYDPAHPHPVIIIDFSGNDVYRAGSDFCLGSGCMSVGLLLDYEGNDVYQGRSFAIGSGFFGLGVVWDGAGDDRYDGDTHVQGAASFGLGMLVDEDGRDIYNAALYSQGFGFIRGIGVIFERDGSDTYYAGGKYKDVLRYEDHYLSLSQGFGYGLRPWMSGGIGAIIDINGNDNLYSDIFAQAASYWWSLGLIYDSTGHDNYQSFQYAQGAATHMTLGLLINEEGNDVYFGKGLMHGCGHDYSCGMILDRHGNDTYTAYDLSQGAGSANGAGVLIDVEGDDRYFVHKKDNTQGYGNPRRDFGSIGLFIDLGGKDQYWGNGQDNYYWRTDSKWGGGMDIELNPPDSTEDGQ